MFITVCDAMTDSQPIARIHPAVVKPKRGFAMCSSNSFSAISFSAMTAARANAAPFRYFNCGFTAASDGAGGFACEEKVL